MYLNTLSLFLVDGLISQREIPNYHSTIICELRIVVDACDLLDDSSHTTQPRFRPRQVNRHLISDSDFETPDYMVSNYETQDFDFGGFEPTPTMSYDCHVNDQRRGNNGPSVDRATWDAFSDNYKEHWKG